MRTFAGLFILIVAHKIFFSFGKISASTLGAHSRAKAKVSNKQISQSIYAPTGQYPHQPVVQQSSLTEIISADIINKIYTQASSPTVAPSLSPNTANKPPDCINNETQIVYVNGEISTTQTFYNCLGNIADPYNIPTFYNGTFNGVMMVQNSIQLNNLHDVGIKYYWFTKIIIIIVLIVIIMLE